MIVYYGVNGFEEVVAVSPRYDGCKLGEMVMFQLVGLTDRPSSLLGGAASHRPNFVS